MVEQSMSGRPIADELTEIARTDAGVVRIMIAETIISEAIEHAAAAAMFAIRADCAQHTDDNNRFCDWAIRSAAQRIRRAEEACARLGRG